MKHPFLRMAMATLAVTLLSNSVLAQEADTAADDKERRRRAREEQREEKTRADSEAAAEAAKTESARQEAERQALGVEEADLPPEENAGFFIALDGFLAETSGADVAIARENEVVSSAATAEALDSNSDSVPDAFTLGPPRTLRLEPSGVLLPTVELGFRRQSGGAFSVRYGAFSTDADLSGGSSDRFTSQDPLLGDLILGTLDNVGVANLPGTTGPSFERPYGAASLLTRGVHGAESVVASGDLEASRLDVLFTRTGLVRKRLELQYRIGLTAATLDRTESARFTWRSFDRFGVFDQQLIVEDVASSSQLTGYGPTVGLSARFGLTATRRWSVRFGVEATGLQSKMETSFRDSFDFTQGGGTPMPTVLNDLVGDDGSRFVTILQGEVALERRVGQRVRFGLGYRKSTWFSAMTETRFPDSTNAARLETQETDLSLAGPFVALGFFF